ncbi:MAG: DNA polymerase IV [Dehalococcoidia bacterium]|nr:DNA polymerase IV [Dehalococcoidia bacterium]
MSTTESPRRIIHVDLDAFFCSVEEDLDPGLKGKPVIVGSDPRGRGVVVAASYPARRFGVHSAMPIGHAARLCPQAVFIRPRHDVYSTYSSRVMDLLREYTPLVEQMSIDEAFLDVTDREDLPGEAEKIGRAIQLRVKVETGLPCSVGIASNKLVAKIATDTCKPFGFLSVPAGEEASFLAGLPVDKLWGVGPKTAVRLRGKGIHSIGDLASRPPEEMRARFGRMGEYLWHHARGDDSSPVEINRQRKSISHDHTFSHDVGDLCCAGDKLLELGGRAAGHLKRSSLRARTVTMRLRYADFSTVTRSRTLVFPTDAADAITETALRLLRQAWDNQRKVRLVGIGLSNLCPAGYGQLSLFDFRFGDQQELSCAAPGS